MEKDKKKAKKKAKKETNEEEKEIEKGGFPENVDFKKFLGCGG
ncbi:hypothetical protein [Ekhidna sp.]